MEAKLYIPARLEPSLGQNNKTETTTQPVSGQWAAAAGTYIRAVLATGLAALLASLTTLGHWPTAGDEWYAILWAVVVAAIPVAIVALNPKDKRYGFGATEEVPVTNEVGVVKSTEDAPVVIVQPDGSSPTNGHAAPAAAERTPSFEEAVVVISEVLKQGNQSSG